MDSLEERLALALVPGFRGRLLDKGLARGLIWHEGTLPLDAPLFPVTLTEDLLDYGFALTFLSLQLRAISPGSGILDRAFLVAGEAIEAAVLHGPTRPDRGFCQLAAAVAFHLGRYSARAYSVLPADTASENLTPAQKVLVQLLRRDLDQMRHGFAAWLLDPKHQDEEIARRLGEEDGFEEMDAVDLVLTTSFMRGMALFDHALSREEASSVAAAKAELDQVAETARDLHFVSHWWTAKLAGHLLDELWGLSLCTRVPVLPDGDDDKTRWDELRTSYIQELRSRRRAAIELWPSQLEAAKRSIDPADNLVVALPTSAGKTRIAELCALRALASGRRVVYITPLRALTAQVARDLAEIFGPLGFNVTTLYGSAAIEAADEDAFRGDDIVVSTPEKLDFALRNDSSVIDDVGLVVLDEGHMLGPSEREVRYEALVQRLLSRDDSPQRRIVCLSALFPTPEEMQDLVAWIRHDKAGEPVHSSWRPTRQRFGVVRWASGAARLEVKVEEESSFVRRFVEAAPPPAGSRRRLPFPSNKSELTLAVAWSFVRQGKQVLVYCSQKRSVEPLGRLVLECLDKGLLTPLREVTDDVKDAMKTGAEWLGEEHPAVRCLKYGVALHHGGLPRPFLNEVEALLRSGRCPITIASPTLAQGLNLSASVLLVPSVWRNGAVIPAAEFANVSGRAGRAFVDVEGLVLHIVWEATASRTNQAIRTWDRLVQDAKAPRIRSGILQLLVRIYQQIAVKAGVPLSEVVEYVTGSPEGWLDAESGPASEEGGQDWERDLASLDSAILALIAADTANDQVAGALEQALDGSLFVRQLQEYETASRDLLRRLLAARARHIWSLTQEPGRRGYSAAGVGLSAGRFLDAHLDTLVDLLARIEDAVTNDQHQDGAAAAADFAAIVFGTQPFVPNKLPEGWREALLEWVSGAPAERVLALCGADGVAFLQEGLTYRLPWAMEAVRVHAGAVGHEDAEYLSGLAALAMESGSLDLSVITLLRHGLDSREAAIAAVTATDALFDNYPEMMAWLESDEVRERTQTDDWPTPRSRHVWLEFVESRMKPRTRRWIRDTENVHVDWLAMPPQIGVDVVVEPRKEGPVGGGLVLLPDFTPVGTFNSVLKHARKSIVSARVGVDQTTVDLHYFGPPMGG